MKRSQFILLIDTVASVLCENPSNRRDCFDPEILSSRRNSDGIHWLRDPLEELVVRVEKNFQLNVLLDGVKKTAGSPAFKES